MSDFQQKDMTGALFKNKKKTDETHPDYQGSVTIKGQKLAIGAWLRKAKKTGESYMSLSIRPWKEKDKADPDVPF